jgi:hypothetical protein
MSSYQNNPFTSAQLVQKGVPCYLFGSYNYKQANTRMLISQVALTSNVATLTVQITEGEIPIVGALVSVQQTASTSGLFNVNRVALSAVSITAATGAGTISFALTHADVVAAADTGTAVAEVPEVGEAVTAVASAACYVQDPTDQCTITTSVTFGTKPTAATVTLQSAIRDVDSEYTDVGNAAVLSGTAFTTGPNASFTLKANAYYRFKLSGLTLGSGAGIVAKLSK